MKTTSLALVAAHGVAAQVYDAVIIGGGLSGLSAGKALLEAGKTFKVLEARDRTGGRTHTVPLENGGWADVGGTFLGPTQDEAIALAAELGIELFDTYDSGNSVMFQNGERLEYATDGPLGPIPPVDEASILQIAETQFTIDAMAALIDVQAPWDAPDAAEWDSISLGAWLDSRELSDTARFLIDSIMESVFSVEPEEQSLLYTAAYVAASGNETEVGSVGRLIATTGGAQMFRIDGGAESLAKGLTQLLGDNVALNSPVASVTKTPKGYDVRTKSGSVVKGKHVIVAMSPPVADRIQFKPALPAARKALQEEMFMGSLGKAIAVYDSSFWIDNGLNGQTVSDSGLARVLWDQSARDGSYGVLMGFLEADQMREYVDRSDEEIVEAAQADFINYFGPEAANATQWIVQVWDREEYSLGGPTAIAGPGVYTQYGPALRTAVGNLHFAGTESSDYWVGYMDGAIRAGKRAAGEVVGA